MLSANMDPFEIICYICEEKFYTYTDITKHLKKKHSCYALVPCPLCLNPLIDTEMMLRTQFSQDVSILLNDIFKGCSVRPGVVYDHIVKFHPDPRIIPE
nr:hypothetical transcript [Hymenolepis microstoma]